MFIAQNDESSSSLTSSMSFASVMVLKLLNKDGNEDKGGVEEAGETERGVEAAEAGGVAAAVKAVRAGEAGIARKAGETEGGRVAGEVGPFLWSVWMISSRYLTVFLLAFLRGLYW